MEFEIRKDRTKPQGRKKLTRERAEYFQLMQQGYSNREACRIVGIDIRTGKKWRNGDRSRGQGRRPLPPARKATAVCDPSRYLREDERIHIADRLREKATIRQIAVELGRSPSTISREIRRNRTVLHDYGTWYYRPHAAHARADARRPRPKARRVSGNEELRTGIQEM